jgi:hypothetical protein
MPKRMNLSDEQLLALIYREIKAHLHADYSKKKLNPETKLIEIGLADEKHSHTCFNTLRLVDALFNVEIELNITIKDDLFLEWKNLNDILVAVKEASANCILEEVG